MPWIRILKASQSNLPYDFECYEDSPPYTSGPIKRITAVAGIGNVEIKVRGHGDRQYGATKVEELNLNQTGVNSSVKEFKISTHLGEYDVTSVDEIAGPFEVGGNIKSNVSIGTLSGSFIVTGTIESNVSIGTLASGSSFEPVTLQGNLEVTGAGPHAGSIDIEYFGGDGTKVIDITGTITGEIVLGCLG